MAPVSESYPPLTKEIVKEILDSEAPYKSEEEKETCQRLVAALSHEEQEIAACTSYAYWFAQTYFEDDSPSEETRVKMAMREARRHLVGSSHDESAALDRLQSSLQYRKEHNLNLFRTLYSTLPDGYNIKQGTPEEEEIKRTMRSGIEDELRSRQVFVVLGADRESRATAIKMSRTSPEAPLESYVTTQLYVAERALACVEFLSRGTQEEVVVLMDFGGYSSSNAPSLLTQKEAVSALQSNYPERLKTAIITEPAFWMRGLYNMVYPFLSSDTAEKIQMASGDEKSATIGALISPEQAMPFMMPNGKLTSEIDVDSFLTHVPFWCPYHTA